MTDEESKIETIKWLIDYVERDTRDTLIKEAAGYEAIKKIIGEAPEKKFPRWHDMGDSYECSDCGYESKYPEKMCPNCHATMANYGIPKNEIVYSKKEQANCGTQAIIKSNYCPMCGVKMDEVIKNE